MNREGPYRTSAGEPEISPADFIRAIELGRSIICTFEQRWERAELPAVSVDIKHEQIKSNGEVVSHTWHILSLKENKLWLGVAIDHRGRQHTFNEKPCNKLRDPELLLQAVSALPRLERELHSELQRWGNAIHGLLRHGLED